MRIPDLLHPPGGKTRQDKTRQGKSFLVRNIYSTHLRISPLREDRIGRDRNSTCSSTAKEPETSSETLPSPQNSDDLLGEGGDLHLPKFGGNYDAGAFCEFAIRDGSGGG